MRNIRHLCPDFAATIINTYRSPARLFVGGEELQSSEGTTQGDPLAMYTYALGTIPLINDVSTVDTLQAWYADDSAAGGKLYAVKEWWMKLESRGPDYGYVTNAEKSVLLVKPSKMEEAKALFADTSIKVVSDGYRHLGAALGTEEFCTEYVKSKVKGWCAEIQRAAEVAQSQPQAVYTTFTQGLRHKWSFLVRVMPDISGQFRPLEDIITPSMLPALTGRVPPGESERAILSLPCRDGGLAIFDPQTLTRQHQDSVDITQPLVEKIIAHDHSLTDTLTVMRSIKSKVKVATRNDARQRANDLRGRLELDDRHALDLAAEKGASSWLTCRPSRRHGFVLSKGEFCDGICLRYGWCPPGMVGALLVWLAPCWYGWRPAGMVGALLVWLAPCWYGWRPAGIVSALLVWLAPCWYGWRPAGMVSVLLVWLAPCWYS